MWIVRGACIGLLCGLIELVIVVWPALHPQSPWPGLFHVSPHWLWLAPFTHVAFGIVIAALIGLTTLAVPWLARPRWMFWVITASGLLAALFSFKTEIGALSLLMAGLGAAVPLSDLFARRAAMFHTRGTQRSAFLVVVVLLAAGAVALGLPASRERGLAAGLPAASDGAPNIVLVVLDTVRHDTLAELPNFARLAASGVRFDGAVATSSWTLESHASMFTGRYPQHVFPPGVTPINFETPMPAQRPTMAEVLRDNGYVTAGFVANTNYTSREHGLARGFVHYDDYPLAADDLLASTALGRATLDGFWKRRQRPRHIGRRSADQITRAFLAWFDRRGPRPVFAFLNYFDAHDPYLPPDGYRSQLPDEPSINPFKRYPTAEAASHRRAYEDCVRYLDDALARLVSALEDRQALDSTVLIVTSDHGEHFGERDLMTHGNSLYRELVEVPLTMRFPKAIRPGTTVAQPVSLRDLPATLLELAGVVKHPLPGTSLSVLWREEMSAVALSPAVSTLIVGGAPHHFAPEFWPVKRGSMRSVVADGFHYIRNGDGVEELYDLAIDRDETSDLAKQPEHAAALARLRAIVDQVDRDDRRP